MSDLASRNDVATNGVNGRVCNKTWYKSECCAPMEISIEGVFSRNLRFAKQGFQVHRV